MSALKLQFTLAARYLAGRKLRTFLTTLAIIFGVSVIFGLNGYLPSFIAAFQQNMLSAAGKVDLTVTSATGGTFSPGITERVKSIDGVAAVTPLLKQTITLPPGKSDVSSLTLAGVDAATIGKVRSFTVVKGRFIRAGDTDTIALGESLAKKLKLKVGDSFKTPASYGTASFRVVGLLSTPSLPGIEEVYVPLEAAQAVFLTPGRINTVEASYEPGVSRGAVNKTVKRELGSNYKLNLIQSGTELFASIQTGQFALNLFGVMALIMGAFIILNTFRTAVAERRHDIGMLRALGASRRTILGAFLAEGLLQGIIGTAVGLVAGYFITVGLIAIVSPIFKTYMHFSISTQPAYTPDIFATAILLGVGVAVAGALFPALSASRIAPVEALRPAIGETYEVATTRRAWIGLVLLVAAVATLMTKNMSVAGLGVVIFIVGMVLVAPALIRPISNALGRVADVVFRRESDLARGNVTRQPNRAAITVSAIMVSLAVVVSLTGLITSIFAGFTSYLDKSMGTDFLVLPQSLVLSAGNVGAAPDLSDKIRSIDGIGTVTSLRWAKTQVNGTAVQAIGIEPKTYKSIATLDFGPGSTSAAFDRLGSGRYIIANGLYAAQNGLKKGDSLTLLTPEGKKKYKIAGIGSDYLNAKLSTIYISQANLARDFHATTDLMVLANMEPGARSTAVQKELKVVLKDYPAFALFDVTEWRQSQLQIFNQSMSFFYLLVILLALPSLLALVNTLTINVVARIHEIGMLRAVGGTRRQIRAMILLESLILSATGTAFGILAGLWLGYVLVAAMNSTGFVMPYYFPWAGILLTIAVGLLFGVLASVLPARQAAKVDIVRALHYE